MVFTFALHLCGCVFDTQGSGGGDLAVEGYVHDEAGDPVPDVKIKAYLS
jgi:hypothetical protein